jgi:hypothetical protein
MKKYLALGLALILANTVVPVQAADSCTNLWLTNASGSPPVVQGNVVGFAGLGIAPSMDIYLDGVYVTSVHDILTPPPNWFNGSGTLWVPYGTHTLRNGVEACTINFSTVPPPAVPGTPTLSTNKTFVRPNVAYTLSWTVPSGSINHYTLHRTASGGSVVDTTLPGNSTAVTLTSSTPPGTTKIFTFTLQACSSSDESICGAWSNSVQVTVDAPCIGGCP